MASRISDATDGQPFTNRPWTFLLPGQSPSASTTNTCGQLCILLFSFQFPLFLWTKLGLFALFSFAFIFFSLITHICASLIENDLYFLTCPGNKTPGRIKNCRPIPARSLSQNRDTVNPGLSGRAANESFFYFVSFVVRSFRIISVHL